MSGRIPDLVNNIARTELFEAARRINGTFDATGVDIKDVQGWGLVIASASLGVGTTPTLDFTVQDSDDNVTFAAAGASLLSGSFTQVTDAAGNGMQVVGVDLTGLRRYVRVRAVVASAAGQGFEFSAVLLGAGRPNLPKTSV